MKNSLLSFVLLSLIVLTSSCREDVDASALEVYAGPMNLALNVHLIQSDSAIVRFEMRAPKQLKFANGDQEFPEGVNIEIFEKDGKLSTTLRADRGFFSKQENVWRGEGDVQVHNLIKDQKLQSEELFWDMRKKIIYTKKFVRVQDGEDHLFGSALEADEAFNNYSLENLRDGQFEVSDDGI